MHEPGTQAGTLAEIVVEDGPPDPGRRPREHRERDEDGEEPEIDAKVEPLHDPPAAAPPEEEGERENTYPTPRTVRIRRGAPGVVLDGLPDPRDVHVDAAIERFEVLAPDELHQGIAGQHLARAARESPEQLELVAGDRPLLAFEPHDPGGAIDLQRPEPERLRFRARPRAPAEDRAQTGEQLAGVEGLRQVVVGADLEAHDPVRGIAPRGEHQDGDVGLGPGAPAEIEAVPSGSMTSRTTASNASRRAAANPSDTVSRAVTR